VAKERSSARMASSFIAVWDVTTYIEVGSTVSLRSPYGRASARSARFARRRTKKRVAGSEGCLAVARVASGGAPLTPD
jgi:hypothetical protein